MDKGFHCYITGRVQGVCFRVSTQAQASLYGLTGWVRNLSDGRVELMAFGNEQQLDKLNHWLKSGPNMARVTNLEIKAIEYEEFGDFEIS